MNRQSILILIVPVILTFSSCYYPAQVVIHNKSGAAKNIRVSYPSGYRVITDNDSLPGYDHTLTDDAFSSRDYHRYGVHIPLENLDTVNKTFSFCLKDKHQVIVETTWPASALPWGQLFIINEIDTVILKRKSSDFKKRGGSWTYIMKGN
jgi:hypothetical protein